ncbi:CRISPR-associated protein Cas6 [Isorropodon fossajaponicum endosymbiont JTNG4]|uniref:type I-MYXAN CRISPR-associated protein Cas6/Cmx6 n=1 Tax=Isorropodon fossajaponicum symbiont TaxID=883811 RepID=UPI001915C186|nr:type I-MYXAN CRISPR-associated protein Cas6/Cmx6 [Isorropodon fossajaponicum symbiont]BBB23817.1 CRISPR-associated protein Cas6 [Isorropodon fossajaponicum endosymbiont JTNG4]
MFWQEDAKKEYFTLPETTQDAVFNIFVKILPIDHSFLLAQALLKHLPWLDKASAGIFNISVADGNGWAQNHENGFYYPSKRSKLIIRVPKDRLDETHQLLDKTLDLGKYQIKIIKSLKPKLLSDMPVLFAKNVACNVAMSEENFLQVTFEQLKTLGISVKKMMAGLENNIKTDTRIIHTRSLMVADLKKDESVLLQEKGLGNYRLLGCGLFIPHKDITSI